MFGGSSHSVPSAAFICFLFPNRINMAAELVDLRALLAEHERRVEERFGHIEIFMKHFTDGSSIDVQSIAEEVEKHGQEMGILHMKHYGGMKGVHELLKTGYQNMRSSLTTLQEAVKRIDIELGETGKWEYLCQKFTKI